MRQEETFAGIPEEYGKLDKAKIVLIPVPYDGTSTWGKGADKGPEAFLEAAENMELYDIETDSEVYKQGIFLADAISENESPEKMVDAVEKAVESYLDLNKFVTLFGGEHSVSIGSIRAFAKKYKDLTIIQLDAHADLRPEYEGSACNHACAVFEASQKHNLIQIGIRSMDVEEKQYLNPENTFFAHQIHNNNEWMQKAIDLMTDNVFVTIDLDAFDPSIMPSTGTPEPGGMGWYQVCKFLKLLTEQKEVVGFDIMELCPNEYERSSDFLAAKLYYKFLSYIFDRRI